MIRSTPVSLLGWMGRRKDVLGRLIFGVVSSGVLLFGLAALERGQASYRNFWGGEVGAVPAIVIGALGLGIAILRPRFFRSPRGTRRDRARKPKKVHPVSPIDDDRKW